MRTLAAAALFAAALVAVPASQTAQNPRLSDSLERPFPANGQIRMDLSAGEYHVSGTNENRVRLQWRVRDPEELSQVRAKADVRGREVSIMTDGPEHFKVDITVDSNTDELRPPSTSRRAGTFPCRSTTPTGTGLPSRG